VAAADPHGTSLYRVGGVAAVGVSVAYIIILRRRPLSGGGPDLAAVRGLRDRRALVRHSHDRMRHARDVQPDDGLSGYHHGHSGNPLDRGWAVTIISNAVCTTVWVLLVGVRL
jgi:hypothetical protein